MALTMTDLEADQRQVDLNMEQARDRTVRLCAVFEKSGTTITEDLVKYIYEGIWSSMTGDSLNENRSTVW